MNWEERIATVHSQQVNQYVSMNSSTPNSFEDERKQRQKYVLTYSVLMVVATYVYVQRSFAFFTMCLRSSSNLHDKLFRGVTNATMWFYNNNPSGRILNRFAKDISSIDTVLPTALIDSLTVSVYFEQQYLS